MGRKKLGKLAKNKTVQIRFDVVEDKEMRNLAKNYNMSLTNFIRFATLAPALTKKEFALKLKKKEDEYKKLLVTANKMLFVIQKLTKIVNFQVETGLKNEVIKDIERRLKQIEKQKNRKKV